MADELLQMLQAIQARGEGSQGHDIDLDDLNEQGVHIAKLAADGDYDGVMDLLSKGASINGQQKQKFTPLNGACFKGHLKVARELVRRGADVNLPDKDLEGPLMNLMSDRERMKKPEYREFMFELVDAGHST
eukprot:GABW01005060.1.p1 GENE.GABW01005060.1~~GABW01005060.1.p1  ORF type:complete len:132 (-),score=13.66 GABW01005060.1:3-398(-)